MAGKRTGQYRVSDETWAEIRRLFEEDVSPPRGYHRLSQEVEGAPSTTAIRHHAIKNGWVRANGEKAGEAVAPAAMQAVNAKRRAELAVRLLDEVDDMLDDMSRDQVLRREAKVVGEGGGVSHVEVVEVTQEGYDPSEKRNLAVATAIMIDKAQLLSGEPTERHDGMTPEERRQRIGQIRDEVEARRALREGDSDAAIEAETA